MDTIISKWWVRGGLAIGAIGMMTDENDEAQKILAEIAVLWAKLGQALGIVTEEYAAEMNAIVERTR